jgi:hypothetical protein
MFGELGFSAIFINVFFGRPEQGSNLLTFLGVNSSL